MTDAAFLRFPHTPHLVWLGTGEPRDDKVLPAREAQDLLRHDAVIEEKVDGANLGLSLGPELTLRLQNRGGYLVEPFGGQFARLSGWLGVHGVDIAEFLIEHVDRPVMLFGEWCAARHSIAYTRLPDWFLLFDVVDRESGQFWSSERRDALATRLGLAVTPRIAKGRFKLVELQRMLADTPSRFRDGPLEGLVVRIEDSAWSTRRAKLVRADFTQTIGDHWRHRRLEWNCLATDTRA